MSQPHHGARMIDAQQAQFALWAPDAASVALELSDGTVTPLQRTAQGWHQLRIACKADTAYRFVVNEHWRVPDPAARQQCDTIHGFSRLVDHQAFAWTQHDWHGRPWQESVICELHVGLMGGFRGLLDWLPYYQQLGITALELMPIGEFPGTRNWGYDGALPFAPDTSYGTPDELKTLIDAAHRYGLMIYLDVIYNHFGPEGNYLTHYASDFFHDEITTPWGPAIDFRRQEVRDFFIQNALMWVLDYRVDGLRLDAVHTIIDHGFLVELAQRVREAAGPERHVHLMLENEHNTVSLLESGFDGQWNDDMHHVIHTILTGENRGYYGSFSEDRTQKLQLCLTQGFAYQDGNEAAVQALPPSRFICYLQNHDQIGNRAFGERLSALADDNRVWAAAAMILLAPMTPMFFMGEELGTRQPFYFFTDHEPELAAAVREGRRKEFHAFFCSGQHTSALPDPNDIEIYEASNPYRAAQASSSQTPAETPYLARYRDVLHLRQQHITPRLHDAHSTGAHKLGQHAVSASWGLGDQQLTIDVNLSDVEVRLPGLDPESVTAPDSEVIYAFRVDRQRGVLLPGSLLVRLGRSA